MCESQNIKSGLYLEKWLSKGNISCLRYYFKIVLSLVAASSSVVGCPSPILGSLPHCCNRCLISRRCGRWGCCLCSRGLECAAFSADTLAQSSQLDFFPISPTEMHFIDNKGGKTRARTWKEGKRARVIRTARHKLDALPLIPSLVTFQPPH